VNAIHDEIQLIKSTDVQFNLKILTVKKDLARLIHAHASMVGTLQMYEGSDV